MVEHFRELDGTMAARVTNDLYAFPDLARLERFQELCLLLRRVHVPCVALAGSHDPVVPPERSSDIARKLTGAREVTMRVFEDARHGPYRDYPRRYAAQVARFVEGLRAP